MSEGLHELGVDDPTAGMTRKAVWQASQVA